MAYSTSPSEDANGVPNGGDVIFVNDITELEKTVTGLTAATAYYFWIRAKNDVGESDYFGGLQTTTDGSYTAGDVGFSVTALDFNTIQASWTQPTGKQLRFTLKRDFGSNITETVVDNDIPSSGNFNTYNDDLLDPNTLHNYIFEVRNEFGSLISTITSSATTPDLPVPTVVFQNIGVRLQFTVTLPDGINLAELEYSISDTVDANGAFTVSPVTEQVTRPVGVTGQTDVVFLSDIRNKLTTFYGHVRLQKNSSVGPWSATSNVTTGDVNPPRQPRISVSSPSTGAVRIKLDFEDGTSTGEFIHVSYRLQSSVGEYTELDTYFRDNPPSDDLDPDEDEIEIIRSGFSPGQQYTFRAIAGNQSGPNSGGPDFDNVNVDN